MTELLSRKAVRHAVLRARNARVVADERAVQMPRLLRMSNDTLYELLVDGDRDEAHVLDFEGMAFMGIPIQTDTRLQPGFIAIDWPLPAGQEAPNAEL